MQPKSIVVHVRYIVEVVNCKASYIAIIIFA